MPLKLITTIIFLNIFISPTNKDPKSWFDTQYTDAIEHCTNNRELITSSLSHCCIPTAMAMSIAFPEMLRYTLWRDILETKALELLYVNSGADAADFSIGWLQMKPSFAEKVEEVVNTNNYLKTKYLQLIEFKNAASDSAKIRSERVARLKIFSWQLIYLSAFSDINCEYLRAENIPYEQMLKYLAAAYNRGMECELHKLSEFEKIKTFPYGPGRTNPFAYSEVSEYFYKTDAKQIFDNPLIKQQ